MSEEFKPHFDIDLPDNRTSKPLKKKQKRLSFLIIILLICIPAIFLYAKTKLTPAEKLTRGYRTLLHSSENSVSDIIGLEALLENSKTKESTKNTELTIESLSSYSQLEGFGTNLAISTSPKKKKLECMIGAAYRGTSVASCDIYLEKNTLYIAAPSLFDDVISIDLSAIEENRESSYLLRQLPDNFYERIDFQKLEDIWSSVNEQTDPIQLMDYIKKTSPKDWETIQKGIKITELEEDNTYRLTISGDAVKTFLDCSMDVILENETFLSYADEIASGLNEAYTVDEIRNTMKQMADFLTLVLKKGITIDNSLNSKNQLTAVKFHHKFSFIGLNLYMDADIKYNGKKNTKDNYEGNFTIDINGEKFLLSIHKDSSHSKKELSADYEYMVSRNGKALGSLTAADHYDKTSGAYLSDCRLFVKGKELGSLHTDGTIQDIKKAERFTFHLNSLTVNTAGQTLLELSGSYSLSLGLKDTPAPPKGKSVNLIEMQKKDFDQLSKKIRENITKLQNSYSELLDS